MALDLTAQKASIFRITHIDNMRWILRNGLWCRSSPNKDPNFTNIGDPELIAKRASRAVPEPPGGTLSDYVPFYFTPHSIMLFNIATGYRGIRHVPNSKIVILFSSLHTLHDNGIDAIFTDSHAYSIEAKYLTSIDKLSEIDWALLRRKDFEKDPEDPGKMGRYQAEALIHNHLPVEQLLGIVCHNENERRTLCSQKKASGVNIEVLVEPSWYF